MKFYLPTLKHLVIQLATLQIYTLNLTTTFGHCKKKIPLLLNRSVLNMRPYTLCVIDMNAKLVISIHRKYDTWWGINRDTQATAHELALFLFYMINTLRPRQNGHHFADDSFKRIFVNENVKISIKISLKFVPKGPINNIPALVQIMAWRRPGDKPLSETMKFCLPTHVCVTRPQWVKQPTYHCIPFI